MPDTDVNENKGFQSRGDSMDAILAQRQEELKQEVEDGGGEFAEDAEADEVDETDKVDKKEDETPDKPDEKEPDDEKEDDDEQTVDLVVDGETKTVKISEAVAIAQKNLAADKRLEEAKQKRKEAEEYLKTAKTTKKEEVEEDNIDEDVEKLVAEKRSAYLHAMNYGEPEEQEKAMIEYEKAVRGDVAPRKRTDTKDLAATIKAEIKEELTGDQIRNRFNLPESQGGFGDIIADEDLKELCFARIDKAIESGADHTSWDTYAKVAQQVRDKFIVKKPKEPASDALEEKKRRKRKVDNLETVSDRKGSSLENANPMSSEGLRTDVISDMAKTRPGQHNY